MVGSVNKVKDIPVQGIGSEMHQNSEKRSNAKGITRKGDLVGHAVVQRDVKEVHTSPMKTSGAVHRRLK